MMAQGWNLDTQFTSRLQDRCISWDQGILTVYDYSDVACRLAQVTGAAKVAHQVASTKAIAACASLGRATEPDRTKMASKRHTS
jgi:hypothetical protein